MAKHRREAPITEADAIADALIFWRAVLRQHPTSTEDGFERRSRLIAESMDIQERRHGRVR